jgi:hypothetical protein
MKVLGSKVSDEFYEDFKTKLKGSISRNVYIACKKHLESEVNPRLTTCKRKNSSCEYQSLREIKLRKIHVIIDNIKLGGKR